MKKFKQHLYESLHTVQVYNHLQDIENAYQIASNLINSNKEIPQNITDLIKKNCHNSYQIARRLVAKRKEVPKELLNTIIKNDVTWSRRLISYYIEHRNSIFPYIPQELLNRIKEDNQAMLSVFLDLKLTGYLDQPYKKQIHTKEFTKFFEENPEFLSVI